MCAPCHTSVTFVFRITETQRAKRISQRALRKEMRKLIAAMNMTLDGYCDHTLGIADDEIHQHYADLLKSADAFLYGRKTFGLMEYWRSVVENPTGTPATDEFAAAIDGVRKVVFSRTLEQVDWRNTELKREIVAEEIVAIKEEAAKDVFVGSPSMIVQLTNLGLIDEYQIAIIPTIAGRGLTLFRDIIKQVDLKLQRTKTFGCGVAIHYYETTKK